MVTAPGGLRGRHISKSHVFPLVLQHDAKGVGQVARPIQGAKGELAYSKGVALVKGLVGVISPH